MATPNKVIEYVNHVKVNAFEEEEKFHWLCDLDGMVKRVVMQDGESVDYRYPQDMDTQLLIPHPYEGLYALYLQAMISLNEKNYNDYNNALLAFDTQFAEYKKLYIREHRPKSAGGFKMG